MPQTKPIENRRELFLAIGKTLEAETLRFVKNPSTSVKDAADAIEAEIELSGMSRGDLERVLGTKPSVKAVQITLEVEPTEGEEVAVDVVGPEGDVEPEEVAEMDEDPISQKSMRRGGNVKASSVFGATGQAPAFGGNSKLARDIKQYNIAAKSRSTINLPGYGERTPIFDDGERAAMAGAFLKNRLIEMYPAELKQYRDNETKSLLKAHGTFPNDLGGALVPEEFLPNLMYFANEFGAFRRAAGVTPMSSHSLTMPRTREFFVVGDLEENGEISSQDRPTFDNVKLNAEKKGGIARISMELLNDSPIALGEVLNRDVERGFDKYIDDSALTGANGYKGMDASTFTTAGTDHLDAALLSSWTEYNVTTIESFLALIPSAAWAAGGVGLICHRSFFGGVLARFGASAASVSDSGAGLFNATVPLPSGSVGGYRSLPVYFSDSMPSSYAADQISCVAGSFPGGCKYGEVRGSTGITTSDQRYFEFEQVGFRATRRLAINLHNVGGAATDGSQTLVVGLRD